MRSLSDTSSPSKTTGAAPLKVLHVGKFYLPHFGGMESHLQTLCEELSKSIEVEVLVASDRRRRERSPARRAIDAGRSRSRAARHGADAARHSDRAADGARDASGAARRGPSA